MIKNNIEAVKHNISQSAIKSGRISQDITLVCVTKQAGIEQIREAIACGITQIGENRVQDAVGKYDEIVETPHWGVSTPHNKLRWHLIGHLQTNKVKKAVELFDLIHSVDSLHLAEAISKESQKINKTQDILIQVNTSGEDIKFGIRPEEVLGLIRQIVLLKNIRVLGLMTIAPLVEDAESARPFFKILKQLSEEIKNLLLITYNLKLITLSMGMSGDYQAAIEEGATMVRIGSAIFK